MKGILSLLVFILFVSLGFGQLSSLSSLDEQSNLRLNFNLENGNLLQMDYFAKDNQWKRLINGDHSLWEIFIQNGEEELMFNSADASSFIYDIHDGFIQLNWSGFSGVGRNLVVKVTVDIFSDSLHSAWKIRLEGLDGLLISKVSFPRLVGITDMVDGNLSVPDWMGVLLNKPGAFLSANSEGFSWDYPGKLSMQFVSLYSEFNQGLYFASNDTLAFAKNFRLFRDSIGFLGLTVDHYPSYVDTLTSYEPLYSVLVSGFCGDWLTASKIYKSWAEQQSWVKNSRFSNDLVPEWLKKTKYWVWNRGYSSKVLPQALHFGDKIGGHVSVLWHWWHQDSYDDSFPEYFPPREGEHKFKKAVAVSKANGINSIVYMNSLKWGTSTKSWVEDTVGRYAVKKVDGLPMSQVYNIFTNKALAYMCESTTFWKNKFSDLVYEGVYNYGLSGIYMDQTCLTTKCYDPTHGHSLGGGNYWLQNHKKKNEMIRSNLVLNTDYALAAEGVGENWLPYNDMFLALQVSVERYAGVNGWKTIPLFQSVYHEHAITFGNYSSLLSPPYDEKWPEEFAPDQIETILPEEYNQQFLMEQARSFVWGMQPTIANYQPDVDDVREKEIDFMVRLSNLRSAHLKYLLFGEYIRSPKIDIRVKEFPISKLSIYAGRKGNVQRESGEFQTLYTSTWKSKDDEIAVVLASIDNEPYDLRFSFGSEDYGLPQEGDIYYTDDKGRRLIGSYRDRIIQVRMRLPAYGIGVLEFI